MSDFKFGDILRISDGYHATVPSAYMKMRVMYVTPTVQVLVKRDPRQSPLAHTLGKIVGLRSSQLAEDQDGR